MQPTIIALVPMRHDSERVRGKNYRPFAGRPLYHHVIDTLLRCPRIGEMVIDTDSPTILEECPRTFPSVRLLERPEHLRRGDTPMNEVLLHTTDRVAGDFYLQTHSTNPLLRPETVERAIEQFLGAYPERCDSLFSVTRWQTRLYDAAGGAINHDPNVLLRTQDLPPVYEENSNLYLFTRDSLQRRGHRIGERPLMFEIDRLEATDIDDEAGWAVAEALAGLRDRGSAE